jgi:uncharacterized protein YjbJ (UPF0337 family)
MDNFGLKPRGRKLRGKLKQHYGNLTGDDLVYSEAKEDEFLGWFRSEMIKPTTQAPPNS